MSNPRELTQTRLTLHTVLTDRFLKNLKPAPIGRRTVHWDAARPSFGVRITDRGVISFFVMRRMHGKSQPVRIVLSRYPQVSLAQARKLAIAAIDDLVSGIHPKVRKRQHREALAAEELTIRSEFPKFNSTHNKRRHPYQELARVALATGTSNAEKNERYATALSHNDSEKPALLDYQALRERGIPWSRVHIARLEAVKKFPLHVDLGENTVAWFEDEIDDLLEMKAAERDAKTRVPSADLK